MGSPFSLQTHYLTLEVNVILIVLILKLSVTLQPTALHTFSDKYNQPIVFGPKKMSSENHVMKLRPRRSVLGDISNRAEDGGNTGLPANPTKRLVSKP